MYKENTMNEQLEQLLALDSESETVEFKEAKDNFDSRKLGKYFSALSNEANLQGIKNGWLVLGVNDQRKVVGTQYRSGINQLNKLKGEIAKQVTGRLTFTDIHEINHPEGRVLLFQIPAAPKGIPIAYQGHYYGRDGEELNALNIEEIERIRLQNGDDWSAIICDKATLNDLSPEALALARTLYKEKHTHLASEVDEWSDTIFLNKAKLCIQGKITNAAILLLGSVDISASPYQYSCQ